MLIYVGKGAIPGIPARDLTEEEVKQLDKKALLQSGLWVEDEKKTSAKKTSTKEKTD